MIEIKMHLMLHFVPNWRLFELCIIGPLHTVQLHTDHICYYLERVVRKVGRTKMRTYSYLPNKRVGPNDSVDRIFFHLLGET